MSDAAPAEISKKAANRLLKQKEKEAKKAEHKKKDKEENPATTTTTTSANVVEEGVDVSEGKYGTMPLIQSQETAKHTFLHVSDVNKALSDEKIWLRGRVHTARFKGKTGFIVLRAQHYSVQCVLSVSDTVSRQLLKYASSITRESIVDIGGRVVVPEQPVHSCSQKDAEVHVDEIWTVNMSLPVLPLQIEDAARSDVDAARDGLSTVQLDTRLNNRILDLRTPTSQAIYRLEAGVCQAFRWALIQRAFLEIHTPKIIGAASEGGANFFKVGYFKGEAYLAQSPQLYKQMAIAADFGKVFTVGAVFRAEDSNTHRHLTEFVGLDIEMAFIAMLTIGNVLNEIFRALQRDYDAEIVQIAKTYPSEPFEFLDPPLVLKFSDGTAMLHAAGVDVDPMGDLCTADEKHLGRLVKEKYHTDFYILDKFPLAIRPFYTMPDPDNKELSNSYDMFMRGEEILSGAQRIHDPHFLAERAKLHGIDLEKIASYIDAFKYGCPPHAGGGIGMERVVMLFLGLGNIRLASMFPRDPHRLAP